MKKYINPILEISLLQVEDVLRTSGETYFENELPLVPFENSRGG